MVFVPEAGFTATTVHTNETTGLSYKSAFTGGISVGIPLRKNILLQPGLFFVPKGAQKTVSTETLMINTQRNVNYLELPVNAVYYFNKMKTEGFFVSAGMYAGLALNGETRKTVRTPDGQIQKITKDIVFGNEVGQLKRFDYGIKVGVGYQSPAGIFIRGQYGLGLENVVNTKYVYNRGFGLTVGFLIGHRSSHNH
ncbi:porin family protein [Chryseobacterium rhizoplanae]|uniref:porin family protein n=1 Tax=Chryseobacterium rhizoplanae TaxID=1609531 RepID=UPI0021D4462F|nr:porin family protein [Chryseobacterium rhizoplanae]